MTESTARPSAEPTSRATAEQGFGFLLVQLGFRFAALFAERLAPLGLEPRQFGALTTIAAAEGESQQAIAQHMGLTATRMVFLVDELERLGLAERRRNPDDRRSHALYLTDQGHELLVRGREVASAHDRAIGDPLTQAERARLTGLLRKLADAQQIQPGSLPGPR